VQEHREMRITPLILNGERGWPFGAPDRDVLATKGYQLEEFLVEGAANAYEMIPGCDLTDDGNWQTRPAESSPFTTRIYVVRPSDPEDFNGVVVVNWQNVSGGFDLGAPTGNEIFRGYAWVGVTTQSLALHGFRADSKRLLGSGATVGLLEWNPERYGSLSHPGDRFAYDIFSQIGKAVGPGRDPKQNDPLGGLDPSIVIATGASQSASRLKSYINIAHQHQRVFDGFLLTVCSGACYPPDDRRVELTDGGASIAEWAFRDDLAEPLFVVNSEAEAWTSRAVRQANTDVFRYWEIAGGPHSGGGDMMALMSILERDGVVLAGLGSGSENGNTLNWNYVADAAMRSLVSWIRDHVAPNEFAYIEQIDDEPSSSIVRDDLGLAIGGLRVPEIEAPTVIQVGFGDTLETRMAGRSRALSREELGTLYVSREHYLSLYDEALRTLIRQGAVLSEDEGFLATRGRRLAEDAPFAS
jgi:hypothetical protein